MEKTGTGLDVLVTNRNLQIKSFEGNVALLAHNQTKNSNYVSATLKLKEIFSSGFENIFSPQHSHPTCFHI